MKFKILNFNYYTYIITIDQLEFLNKMKSIIVNDDKEVCKEGFYEWKIKKWNELGTYKLSPTFYIGDCAWYNIIKILFFFKAIIYI